MKCAILEDMVGNFSWHQDQLALHTLTLSDLFHETSLDQHLTRLTTEFGSPTRAHAASMTAKRIGYIAALMIYALNKHAVLIHPKVSTFVTIAKESTNTSWKPVYSFPLETAEPLQSTVEWITQELYAQTIVPIVELLSKERGISRVVLFENIFIYIRWIFISKLQDNITFQQLIESSALEFGVKKLHPIALYESGRSTLRKTCCLYYQTHDAVKTCKTCPL